MKWKMLFSFLCIILIGSVAYANDESYIVQFNDKIQMFATDSDEQHESRNYTTATYDELQEYLDADIVEYYEPDYEIELMQTFTAQEEANKQWNHTAIKLAKPWSIGCYGNDVVVGVIDSGCYNHPDLSNNILSGTNYTSVNQNDTNDNIGHGTYVSGIIAAECNGEYINGVAYKAKIVPLKCFDNGVTTKTSMISDAIYDAIDVYNCDVINMSFGVPISSASKTLENAIKYALKNNCILIAAVGNDGKATEYYPAKFDNVIGVGSINKNGSISYFSQRNSTVDCVAPGEAVQSVSIDGYTKNSGTSFAAPHITAVAAIAKCINKDITAQEFIEILSTTSCHPNDSENAEKQYDVNFGYGLVDAEKMFDELLKNEKYFLAPISVMNNQISTVVYNNSGADLKAKSIITNYLGGVFNNTIISDLDIPSGEYRNIQSELPEDKLKIMIWSNMTNFVPLTSYKEFIRQ